MLPNPEVREVSIHDYLKIVQKRLGLIIVLLVVVPTVVAIVDNTTKPMFRASTSIVIERYSPQSQITKMDDSVSPYMVKDQEYYQTQYGILNSRSLAERVFDQLNLVKDDDYRELRDPISKLRSQVRVDPVRNSQVVIINVEDIDALRASSIANALANEYIKQDSDSKGKVTRQALGWLEAQVTDMKKKVEESELTLNRYLLDNKILTSTDVKERESLLQRLKSDKSKTETELATVSERYKQKHPKIIALNAELKDLKRKIDEESTNVREMNDKMVKYNILKKENSTNQQLYEKMLDRLKNADIIQKTETTNIRVIDSAKPPRNPFKPQKQKDLVNAFLFAIFGGLGLAFFLEYLDSSIRTAEDVSVYLSLPFLGYIPSTGKEAITDREKALICHAKPQSRITEAYRAARTSVIFASPEDRPLKNILITSSLPQEGKSFFAVNISTIFANINERVILIDVDMRRPKIYKSLDFDLKPGLSNYLTGNIPLDSIIKATPIKNLSVITSGTIPPNPSELLSSGKMRMLMDQLKSKFDRIVIDSPPILSVADTSLLANMVDGVILVIKGGVTRLEAITRSKSKILEARGRIIGVVVNNIEPEKEDRYYYYHYYYSEEGKKPKV